MKHDSKTNINKIFEIRERRLAKKIWKERLIGIGIGLASILSFQAILKKLKK